MQAAATDTGQAPQLSVNGAIATLQLCRPMQANRIESGDVAVLLEHCQTLRYSTGTHALILTGSGKYFSAGYDLGAVLAAPGDAPALHPAGYAFANMVAALEALPQVTVCALNGSVHGGSTDLALACDFRIGVSGMKLRMPAARLGLHYPLSGLQRYVSRLGLQAAKRLFLLAEELDAAQLMEIGYLDAVVVPQDLIPQALALAESAALTAPLARAGMKATLNAIANDCVDTDKVAAIEWACLRSGDLTEGLAAWVEKRPARFEGS